MEAKRKSKNKVSIKKPERYEEYSLYIPKILLDIINEIQYDDTFILYFGDLISWCKHIIRRIKDNKSKASKMTKKITVVNNSIIKTMVHKDFKKWRKYFNEVKDEIKEKKNEINISNEIVFNIETKQYYNRNGGGLKNINSLFTEFFMYQRGDNDIYRSFQILSLLYMYYDKDNFYKYLDEYIERYKLDDDMIKIVFHIENIISRGSLEYGKNTFLYQQPLIVSRIQQKLNIEEEENEVYIGCNVNFYFFYIRFLEMKKKKQDRFIQSDPRRLYYYYPIFKYFSRVDYNTKFNYISNEEALKILSDRNYISKGIYKLEDVEDAVEKNNLFHVIGIDYNIMVVIKTIDKIYNPPNLIYTCLYQVIIKNVDIQRIFNMLKIDKNTPLTIKNMIKFIRESDNFNGLKLTDPTNFKLLESDIICQTYPMKELIEITGFQVPREKWVDIRKYLRKIMTQENFVGVFIPIKNRRCVPEFDNDEISYNSEEDYKYIFAIGNNQKYQCYDFEEVEKVMTIRDQLDIYDFNTNTYNTLDEKLARNLVRLTMISNYPNKDRFVELLKKLIEDLKFNIERYFNSLSPSEKILLKDFFLSIFYLGMLTRRWNPDDDHYPMSEIGTKHGDRGVTEGTMSIILSQNFGLFKENILDHLTKKLIIFLNSIICMTKHGSRIEEEDTNSDRKILRLLYRTFEEKDFNKVVCQRIASNAFITTGDYYLKLLFNYQIPNFDINKMGTII